MPSSKSMFPVHEPEKFYSNFPHLNDENHTPTSRATPQPGKAVTPYYIYNCFAFVVGDKKKFWWPDYPYSYWPRPRAVESVEQLMLVLAEDFGYVPCENGDFEPGVQKVAIYVNGGVPVHIAIQPSSRNGIWKSKMSYNIDMEHDLRAIETWPGDKDDQGFGKVVQYMKVKKR